MLTPMAWRIPPANYGPWERATSQLTTEHGYAQDLS